MQLMRIIDQQANISDFLSVMTYQANSRRSTGTTRDTPCSIIVIP